MSSEQVQLDPARVKETLDSLQWQQHQDMLLQIAQLTVYVRQLEGELAALKSPTVV